MSELPGQRRHRRHLHRLHDRRRTADDGDDRQGALDAGATSRAASSTRCEAGRHARWASSSASCSRRTDRLSHGTTVGHQRGRQPHRLARRAGLDGGARRRAADPQQHRAAPTASPSSGSSTTRPARCPSASCAARTSIEVTERIDAFGDVVVPLDEDEVVAAVRAAARPGGRDARGELPLEPPQPGARGAHARAARRALPRPLRQLRLTSWPSGSASTRAPRPPSSTPTSGR